MKGDHSNLIRIGSKEAMDNHIEALKSGKKTYNGYQCARCLTNERYSSSQRCVLCKKNRRIAITAISQEKAKLRVDGLDIERESIHLRLDRIMNALIKFRNEGRLNRKAITNLIEAFICKWKIRTKPNIAIDVKATTQEKD